MEHFPTIHTNFWDAVIAVPVVMIITQILKRFFHIKPFWVPTVALVLGLFISVFISHRGDLLAGLFMGWVLWLFCHRKLRIIKNFLYNLQTEKSKEKKEDVNSSQKANYAFA